MNSSELPPISHLNAMQSRGAGPPAGRASEAGPGSRGGGDRLELSAQGAELSHLLQKAHALPDVRPEKVAHAREQIESGGYDRDEVAVATVEALLAEEEL